jgi:hypothetical protein
MQAKNSAYEFIASNGAGGMGEVHAGQSRFPLMVMLRRNGVMTLLVNIARGTVRSITKSLRIMGLHFLTL